MKTFKLGGIHPEENKLAKTCTVEYFPVPKQAVVFLTQHLGAPATPVVQKGDKVKVGQLIGKADAFICANVHSPVSGTVSKIEPATDFLGYKKDAVFIDVEGDEWDESIDTTPDLVSEIKLTKAEIIDRMKACGIVGLGGACFPTHVKYLVPPDKKVDYLIINAAECEPYITVDYRMMLERAEEVMVGIEAMLVASNAPVALIGVEANKPDAIEHLTEVAKKHPKIQVVKLKTKYPQHWSVLITINIYMNYLRKFVICFLCILCLTNNRTLLADNLENYSVVDYSSENKEVLYSSYDFYQAQYFYYSNVNMYDNLCLLEDEKVLYMEYGTLFLNSCTFSRCFLFMKSVAPLPTTFLPDEFLVL